MTISEERSNGIEDVRNEYMRMSGRAHNEIIRRVSWGLTRFQALTGLSGEILGGNLSAVCSPPPPGSSVARRPSTEAIGRVIRDLNAAWVRERSLVTAPISSALTLGSRASGSNAVRNLEPELSVPRPPNQRIVTAEIHSSLGTLSSNRIRNLRHLSNSRNRNTNRRERTPTPRKSANVRERSPLASRNANVRERSPLARRNANEWERTLPRGIVKDPERTPSPSGIVNDPERTPPPRGIISPLQRTPPPRGIISPLQRTPPSSSPPRRAANDVERTRPTDLRPRLDPNIPSYQYSPELFNPLILTLEQAMTVMCSFNIRDDAEYELIRNTFFRFSIKIYGLANCARKDLVSAVLFFLRRYFNMQPGIALCVRTNELGNNRGKSFVGVLFNICETARMILERSGRLNNTQYSVSRNDMLNWIIWNY